MMSTLFRHPPARTHALLLCVVAATGSGCMMNPFDQSDYLEFVPNPDKLYQIQTVDFSDQSRVEPVEVETASADLRATLGDLLIEPERTPLTLEEARASALANNLDLQVQLINPLVARTAIDEEEARFEATFEGSFFYSKTDSPTLVVTEGTQTDFGSANLAVRVPLRTGGTFRVNLPMSRTDTNNAFSTVNPAYTADLEFSISQPLLRNAGNRTNTFGIRVAKYQEQIANAQTKLEAIRVLAAVERGYWVLYAVERELEVAVQQYELADEQLARAERRVRAGDAAEVEILRAESGLAARVEAIIVADAAVRQANRTLKRVLNNPDLPLSGSTRITPTTEPDPVGLDLDPARLTEFALENRMEMLELEIQLAIDASTIDFRENQKLPLFTVDYTYRLNGLGLDLGGAFEQIGRSSFADWTVALSAEIPLGNEAAEARLHSAMLRRIQRLATRDQRGLAIRQEVYDAWDGLTQSWQRIIAARREAIAAGRTLQAEQRQFDVGARTSTDVLIAATDLANAQSSEIRALTDYQISQVDLAFATGTLLGYERIQWGPVTEPPIPGSRRAPAETDDAPAADPTPAPPAPAS